MTQRRYKVGQHCMTYIVIVSLVLQSCNRLSNTITFPIEENQEQIYASQAWFEKEGEENTAQVYDLASTEKELEEEDKENEESRNKKRKTGSDMYYALGEFDIAPRDILKEILSYLGSKEISKVRQLNKS